MENTWKTVRVFISSTFRDMHAERDWLVKRVFPALREKLEKYRVHLIDIDLRWGVTKEQADNAQALDVCLDQIDECRPFFLGILGGRYGWVSHTIPERVTSKWGWIRHHTGKSITDLEILYGVLNNPAMHSHAFFFFRAPSFLDYVPAAKRVEMQAEDGESAAKLARLKEANRGANLPVPPVENYPCHYAGLRINRRLARLELSESEQHELDRIAGDGLVDPAEHATLDDRLRDIVHRFGVVQLAGLEDFGNGVLEKLWQSIKTEHQLPDQPPAAALAATDPLAEEADYHERFMESRLRVYVGRETLDEELTRFATGDGEIPCLVTWPSGSGKSATLAHFVHTLRQTNLQSAIRDSSHWPLHRRQHGLRSPRLPQVQSAVHASRRACRRLDRRTLLVKTLHHGQN